MHYDESTLDLVRASLVITLKIAGPILLAGVLIGLVISVVQAVTQVQEQTLTLVPKIFAMIIVALVLLPWIVMRLVEFAAEMLTLA
ncbi:MAG: flagellar biosynthetic protein FliQ [Planctomycetes bacterium]|nr:flagellar biosynthetic protein FliQ [Planctomycetota bacterium]